MRHSLVRGYPRTKGAAMAVDVETLEESFDLVAPQGDELMRKFYDRLFEFAPSVQPLFADVDMERQRQALLNMLVVLRESLRDLDDIVPDLEDLGASSRRVRREARALSGRRRGAHRDNGGDRRRRLETELHSRVARGIRSRSGRDGVRGVRQG
jgi:hypothetical protein